MYIPETAEVALSGTAQVWQAHRSYCFRVSLGSVPLVVLVVLVVVVIVVDPWSRRFQVRDSLLSAPHHGASILVRRLVVWGAQSFRVLPKFERLFCYHGKNGGFP